MSSASRTLMSEFFAEACFVVPLLLEAFAHFARRNKNKIHGCSTTAKIGSSDDSSTHPSIDISTNLFGVGFLLTTLLEAASRYFSYYHFKSDTAQGFELHNLNEKSFLSAEATSKDGAHISLARNLVVQQLVLLQYSIIAFSGFSPPA